MVIDNSFLKKHLVDLVHSGVSLEGALATRSQVEDILERKSVNLSSKTVKIVQNISLAFRCISSNKIGSYNSPNTLQSLHLILSDSVEDFAKETSYRGKFRDFPVENWWHFLSTTYLQSRCFLSSVIQLTLHGRWEHQLNLNCLLLLNEVSVLR